ncbi:uncharacterized protein LOC127852206 isoform X2 [Dreissena polymorpha]|uniref:Uncharacterized protein n=1 Tax=Dreissena polymorpha TaxID=45954 RepID=A0A9D4NA23_DREPO|nr:uncharacterized protein LOC127852206 isoform X2 [Dreissena polymorpha]KAH3890560.1 hypothetical protein DPMN_014645 [Dreissena polymorpha]
MMTSYHLNDDGCQRVLSRAHNDLMANIDVDKALTFLEGFLKKDDVVDIKNLFTNRAKCRVLIRGICKGGVNTYRKFKEYLVRYHSDLLKILEKHEEEPTLEHPDNEVVNSSTQITDIHLQRITLRIHHNFDLLSANLRIAEQTVKQIKKDYNYSHYEQVYQILREWKEQNKSDATYGFLISQVQKCPGLRPLKLSDFGRQTLEDDGVAPQPGPLFVTRPGIIQCDYCREGNEPKEISSHVHDGRLVELRREYISHLKMCLSATNPISNGGFGKVFITHSEVPAFKQRIVLKEIDVGYPYRNKELLGYVTSEKLASRIMHFGIVPLLAYHDDHVNGKFYFISPYFVNGDLYEAIKSDRNAEDKMIRMHMNTRLRAMYQVACAINYMHTKNSFRGTILHMDIKSKNIVLDSQLNARLIDFGLARELKEGNCSETMTTVDGTKGYFPTVQHKRLTQQHDCHNFGVVMRELLTGRNPRELDTNDREMRKWHNFYVKEHKQKNIWTDTEVTEQIVNISYECIRSIDAKDANYTGDGKFTSKDLYSKLEKLMRVSNDVPKWMSVENNRCDICLLNESVPDVHAEIDYCPHPIKTCCACMRNSYINPVKCYDCGNDVKSIIGHGWGAILIAGHKQNGQEMFDLDIKQFADAITNVVLPAMCISRDNIEIIDSNKETLKELSAKIDKAFDRLDSKDIHTLVFLYSGHNHAKEGFWLGENEYYSMERINNKIKEREKIEQVIAFLDCCKSKPIEVRTETILIQFNASGQKDDAICVPNEDSFFTKYLVQAFTMKASGGECSLHKSHCTMKGDFISLGSLWDYLNEHREGLMQMNTSMHLKNVDWRSTYLAYNYAFKVEISFNVIVPQFSLSKIINVTPAALTDFQTLKSEILFPKYIALLGEHFEYHATAKEFKLAKLVNALAIEVDLASRHVDEIGNMKTLMLAWNSKRMIRCKLRKCERIDKGKPVVLLLKKGQRVSEMVSEISDGKMLFDLRELDHMIQSLKNQLPETSGELSEALIAFIIDVHAIRDETLCKDTTQRVEIEFINIFDDESITLVYLELKGMEIRLQTEPI